MKDQTEVLVQILKTLQNLEETLKRIEGKLELQSVQLWELARDLKKLTEVIDKSERFRGG